MIGGLIAAMAVLLGYFGQALWRRRNTAAASKRGDGRGAGDGWYTSAPRDNTPPIPAEIARDAAVVRVEAVTAEVKRVEEIQAGANGQAGTDVLNAALRRNRGGR